MKPVLASLPLAHTSWIRGAACGLTQNDAPETHGHSRAGGNPGFCCASIQKSLASSLLSFYIRLKYGGKDMGHQATVVPQYTRRMDERLTPAISVRVSS